MTRLVFWLAEHRTKRLWEPPYAALNLLQEHGVISDECVWTNDVCIEDCHRKARALSASPNA